MTKSERFKAIQAAGCICCALDSGVWSTPCEIHHRRHGYGTAQRAPWTETMGLCPGHHRGLGGMVSIHGSPLEWRRHYGARAAAVLGVPFDDPCDAEALLVTLTDRRLEWSCT